MSNVFIDCYEFASLSARPPQLADSGLCSKVGDPAVRRGDFLL